MRTFEFDDGKTRKFWKIDLAGTGFTVYFGKIGTAGQQQAKSFPNSTKAQKEHDKLIAEKVKKGYVETTGGGAGQKTPATVTPANPGGFHSPLRTSLETALAENPDDLATHMAYADHIHELGDPRGEFIQVQLALENADLGAGARKPLQAREKELLTAHEKEWLGPLANFLGQRDFEEGDEENDGSGESAWFGQPLWRRGWIDTIRVERMSPKLALAFIQQSDQFRLTRTLQIIGANDDNTGMERFAQAPFLRNVRSFQIGHESEGCHMPGDHATAMIEKMPLVEVVHCYARRVDTAKLFAMDLPHLRHLRVYHIYEFPLAILAANKSLANLTHLECWPHGLESDAEHAYITSEGAQAIFRSKHLSSLLHLQLRLSDTGDEGMRVLAASGLLKRLKTLDLYGGCVTDAGAQALAACPDLSKLDALNLGSNMIGTTGQSALRATGVKIDLGQQHDPDDDEFEYLCEGDPE